jgi:hypothetical protein
MSTIVLDHTQDISGQDIHRLTSLFPPPDFVKSASHEELCGDPESLPRHLYADAKHKLYPAHTAAATWMSTVFYLDKQASIKPEDQELIESQLQKSATWFGIAGVIESLKATVKAAGNSDLIKLSNDDFAIVWDTGDGPTERHWPLRNAKETQHAAAHFATYRDDFTFPDRHKIANKILDKSLIFGADLEGTEEILHQSAGRGTCSARDAADLLHKRALLLQGSQPELSQELEKTAQIIRANPESARGHDKLLKFAEILDQADRAGNLHRRYGESVDRPEEILFRVGEKQANEFVKAHTETLTGNVYALDDLEKASVEAVREWMGDSFADEVTVGGVFLSGTKLAAILPTLDRGSAAMFDRCMAEMQIKPVVVQKAAAAPGLLSQGRLFEQAAAYEDKIGFIEL